MKKVISALVMCMMLALTGCGKNDEGLNDANIKPSDIKTSDGKPLNGTTEKEVLDFGTDISKYSQRSERLEDTIVGMEGFYHDGKILQTTNKSVQIKIDLSKFKDLTLEDYSYIIIKGGSTVDAAGNNVVNVNDINYIIQETVPYWKNTKFITMDLLKNNILPQGLYECTVMPVQNRSNAFYILGTPYTIESVTKWEYPNEPLQILVDVSYDVEIDMPTFTCISEFISVTDILYFE